MSQLAVFLATIAVATAHSIPITSCIPKTYFKTDCNVCVCAQDGSTFICSTTKCSPGYLKADGSLKTNLDITQKLIPDATEMDIVPSVEVGHESSYYVPSHPKQISNHKQHQILNTDHHQVLSHDQQHHGSQGSHEIEKQHIEEIAHIIEQEICTPNISFYKGCDFCQCSGTGTQYQCTRYRCSVLNNVPQQAYHHRITRSAEEQVCEPGTRFYDYCNVCACSQDGQTKACTKMACDERIFNKNGSLKSPYDKLIIPTY